MPQVWVTYEELGEVLRSGPSAVQQAIIENDLPRRKSSDGRTRIKLSPTLAHEFMLNYAARNGLEILTNDMADRLRGLLCNGRGDEYPRPQAESVGRRIA
jgi:hypothetical protein